MKGAAASVESVKIKVMHASSHPHLALRAVKHRVNYYVKKRRVTPTAKEDSPLQCRMNNWEEVLENLLWVFMGILIHHQTKPPDCLDFSASLVLHYCIMPYFIVFVSTCTVISLEGLCKCF